MNVEALIASLMGQDAQRELSAANPFNPLESTANQIGNYVVSQGAQGKADLGEVIIGSLLSGGASGLFGDMGRDYSKRQQGALFGLLGGQADKENLIPDELETRAVLAARAQGIIDEQNRKKKLEDMTAEAISKDPFNADAIRAALLGQQVAPREPAPQTLTEIQQSGPQFDPGVKSIRDKIEEAANDFRRQGFPAGKAMETATKLVGDQMQVNKFQLEEATKARDTARSLDALVSQAEMGAAGAGKTGGKFGGVRDVASQVSAAFGNDEQTQKQANQAQLESAAQQFMGVLRTPGSGAMSDFETKALLKGAPGADKTPEENAKLFESFRLVAEGRKEYADFLEFYRDRFGTLTGAGNAWDRYLKANPIAKQKDGIFVRNTERTPWTEFDFRAPKKGEMGLPSAGSVPSAEASNVPSVGQTFQGERVVRVTRVK